MSIDDLHAALELIKSNPEVCFFAGARDPRVVELAEKTLCLQYPPSYREFLLRLGAGNVGAEEIYGVIDDDFVDSGVPDGVWMTLRGRREWGLPDRLAVIYFDGATSYFALDTADRHSEEECPIVVWSLGLSKPDDGLEVVAQDFGSFLLEIARRAIPDLT